VPGGRNFDETKMQVANNRILHGVGNASFIEFNELPR